MKINGIDLYCVKNRFGTIDIMNCAEHAPMWESLNKLSHRTTSRASVIYISRDGNHIYIDYSQREFNPEE